jgi:hypothetical protein
MMWLQTTAKPVGSSAVRERPKKNIEAFCLLLGVAVFVVFVITSPEAKGYLSKETSWPLTLLEAGFVAYVVSAITWKVLRKVFGLQDEEEEQQTAYRRESLSAAVKREVWRRDDGRCSQCGSRERLEYDHIIPVSQGGSNTVRNIELLCEPCNRRKGSRI